MAKFRYIKQFYKHFVQFTRRFQENSESSWKISDMKMLVTFTKWWKNGKLWKARCWVLSDCLIVQSRHAKSFSRFLLDTDEPILVTRGLGLWNIEEEGGDLPVWHHTPGTRPAPPAPLLHAIDAVPMLHIMNNFNKIFGCRKKNKIFSKSGRAGVAFNIISTRNRYKTFKNFLWKTLFQSSRAWVSCIFPSQGRIFRLKC